MPNLQKSPKTHSNLLAFASVHKHHRHGSTQSRHGYNQRCIGVSAIPTGFRLDRWAPATAPRRV